MVSGPVDSDLDRTEGQAGPGQQRGRLGGREGECAALGPRWMFGPVTPVTLRALRSFAGPGPGSTSA